MNSVAVAPADDVAFMGHPRGLFYLAFTEAWERFSFYGMTALVVLYMVNQLLLPGHVEQIAGFAGFRAALESVFGPLSTQALASQIFGLYAGFVYFTPILGGFVADRWIGQRSAVVIGAVAMSAGHIAMVFDQSFLLALALLVFGSGFLKGNIAAQVGSLYPPDDAARRSHGFVIFSTGINIGSIAGPLLCGLLAQVFGWHYGFGIAAVFMLLGLATYLQGYRFLPARVERKSSDGDRLTPADRRVVYALIGAMTIAVFQSIAYYQLYNANAVWIEQHVALDFGTFRIPVAWFQAVHAIFCVLCLPLLFWIWRHQAARGREPGDLAKIGTGAWLSAASNLVLVGAILSSGGTPIHPFWPFLYSAGLGIAFMYYWPTLLALVSRAAPARVNSTLMGLCYIVMGLANLLIGWVGGFYEKMSPAGFWTLHAAIGAAGGLLVLLFGRRLSRTLEPA